MKKIFKNAICFLIPIKSLRKKLREHLKTDESYNKIFNIIKKDLINIQHIIQKNTPCNYYKVYKKYELSYYEKAIQWLYEDNINKKNLKVLDIGCAYGTLSVFCKKILNADVFAIDFLDKYYPKKLFNDLNIKFSLSNIEKDEILYEEKFDIIILTEVLEHFNFNPIPTLIKIRNALNKNGKLYITTPNAKYWGRTKYYEKFSDIPNINSETPIRDDHIWQYNITELLYVFEEAGLSVVDFEYSNNGRQFNVCLMKDLDIKI